MELEVLKLFCYHVWKNFKTFTGHTVFWTLVAVDNKKVIFITHAIYIYIYNTQCYICTSEPGLMSFCKPCSKKFFTKIWNAALLKLRRVKIFRKRPAWEVSKCCDWRGRSENLEKITYLNYIQF